jgi:hypothetical protein
MYNYFHLNNPFNKVIAYTFFKDHSRMIFIFKHFHYFKFNYFIKVLKLFLTTYVNSILVYIDIKKCEIHVTFVHS